MRSISLTQAKVWIDEDIESTMNYLNRGENDILFSHWVENSEDEMGLKAPQGIHLEIKGGWLTLQNVEQIDPYKLDRSSQLFATGYT